MALSSCVDGELSAIFVLKAALTVVKVWSSSFGRGSGEFDEALFGGGEGGSGCNVTTP